MKTKIIIIGGRGTALNIADEIRDAIEHYNAAYELLGFANDVLTSEELNGYPVVCKIDEVKKYYGHADVKIIFALYKPDRMQERHQLLDLLQIPAESQFNFIHPTAYVSPGSNLGHGNVLFRGVQVFNSVSIGNNNIINASIVIEHDTAIANANFIAAGSVIGANVAIANGCFIGLNATVRENVSIADYTMIGMSSAVLKNIHESHSTWYGNPARRK